MSHIKKREEIFIPRQLREIKEWRPWQQKIIELSHEDSSKIHVIYSKDGNIGKSILCTWFGVYEKGVEIPALLGFNDIMRVVTETPKLGLYLVDIPRAANMLCLDELYQALETVKDGYAYNDRHKFREEIFDPPNVFVFTSKLPKPELIRSDKWKIWEVDADYNLAPYVKGSISEEQRS